MKNSLVGLASIIMVLVVVSITCIAAVALVQANNDLTLTDKSIDFVKDYYNAEGNIAKTISDIVNGEDDEENEESKPITRETLTLREQIDDNKELVAIILIDGKVVDVISKEIQSNTVIQEEYIDLLIS